MQDYEIPFQVDEKRNEFLNAMAMMEPFPHKRMHNFMRNKTTVEFLNALHEKIGEAPISVSFDYKPIGVKWGGKSDTS